MNLATELVVVALRYANQSGVRRSSSSLDDFVSVIATGKTVEQRQAEQLIQTVKNVKKAVQCANTKRKFKLIVNNG